MATRVLDRDSEENPTRLVKANRKRANCSGGPNLRPKAETGTARSMRPTTPIVPATKEPTADTVSAAPARPRRAIWCPSRAVMTEADSPGTFTRTEEIVPPYIDP